MEWEGTSFEDDPQDPGGATKFGIDQSSHPHVNIRSLTEDQAKAIYWQEWDSELCPKMPRPISEVYFNFCVNAGIKRAVYFLQDALGVPSDGVIGSLTLGRLSDVPSQGLGALASKMISAADHFYVSLDKPRFLKGWLNRDADLRKFIV